MIKLNNKNITYVALADSNNSVKGVKEIWYADSANSVKLVYRRKDALIEGEDYEKYHWLDGDGSTYINTLVSDLTNVRNIYCKIKRPSDVSGISSQRVFGRENPSGYSGTRFVIRPYDNHLELYTSTTAYTLFTDNDDYIEVNAESNSASTSQQSKTIEDIKKNGISLGLFAAHVTYLNFGAFYKGSIGEFTIDELMQLIPCKLLKPVPKWLDANGIRRQVGECGMIDLVSGKFYGNVNSVGTFTVENYYERKEWLVGDGNAYIDVKGFSRNENWEITTKTKLRENSDWILLYGVGKVENTYTQGVWTAFGSPDATKIRYRTSNGTSYEDMGINNIDNQVVSIVDTHTQMYFNDNPITAIQNRTYAQCNEFYIFSQYYTNLSTAYRVANADFSNFVVKESGINILNLIPCTLTMDLPASMDANNIARTKGTSGMWDLVSDRFYGNVASSGTFKAVNLVEGVDYEVHQWLKGDGAAFIRTDKSISIGDEVDCSIIPINDIPADLNWRFVYGNDGGDNPYTFMCVIFASNSLRFRHKRAFTSYISNKKYSIKHSISNVFVDGTELTYESEANYTESSRTLMLFNSSNSTTNYVFSGYIGNFRLTNKLSLSPVRLLRSIPASFDANGIARQAGECGMYDTVNDRFYGNVANSGTFSVSDDS